MKLLLGEVFEHVKKLKKKDEKIAFLRHQAGAPPGNRALFYALWLAFSDKVEFLLPEGAPPFVPWEELRNGQNRPGSEPTDLTHELRRLYLLLKGTGDHLPRMKREKIFQEWLVSFPKADRDLILAIKDKKVATEYKLTRALLDETFPGLMDAPFNNKFASR